MTRLTEPSADEVNSVAALSTLSPASYFPGIALANPQSVPGLFRGATALIETVCQIGKIRRSRLPNAPHLKRSGPSQEILTGVPT